MFKPLRILALTAACAAVLALGACSDGDAGDNAGSTPTPTATDEPHLTSPGQRTITGKWEYIPEGSPVAAAGFTVAKDGSTVTDFWKEGVIGKLSATLEVSKDGRDHTLVWNAETEDPNNSSEGTYLFTIDEGGDSLTATVPGDDDHTFTFTRA